KRQGTSRSQKQFAVAHENFCWLCEKGSRDAVVDEQKRYMRAVVSDERPWDYIEAVYLTGTIDEIQHRIQERIDVGVEEIFPHAIAELADVRDRGALEGIRDRLTGLDILIPNAGVNTRVKALDLPDQALREMLETNLYGVFLTCQVFAPLLFAKPGGRVVITSSVSAVHGMDLRAAYTATKAGLSGLVRSLAIE